MDSLWVNSSGLGCGRIGMRGISL